MHADFPALVSAEWLSTNIHDPQICVIDATFHMPHTNRNAADEFTHEHLPGAVFFDIDKVADHTSTLPHMLPSGEEFGSAVATLGMTNDTLAVVYDTHGLMSAARLWWMFRIFGHDRVTVLDGGLPAWKRLPGPLAQGPSTPKPSHRPFVTHFRPELVRTQTLVANAIDDPQTAIIDARGSARFSGQAPEPRAGVRSGHIPGSISLPYTELLNERGELLCTDELTQRFAQAGISAKREIIASCGSGVTACVLALGLAQTGRWDVAVYDGSWSEWGADPAAPIELGDGAVSPR